MNRILRIAPAIIAGMILFVTAMGYSTAQEPKGSIKEAVRIKGSVPIFPIFHVPVPHFSVSYANSL